MPCRGPRIREGKKLRGLGGFNARSLIDVLGAMAALDAVAAQDVQVKLTDDLSPGVLRPAGESATHFTAVVMPMRI